MGIAFADCIRDYSFPAWYMLFTIGTLWLILCLTVKAHKNYNTGWIAGGFSALLIFLCGMWSSGIDYNRKRQAESLPEILCYRAVILDMPESDRNAVRAIARVLAVKTPEGWIHQNMKMVLYIPYDSTGMPHPGTELTIESPLKNIPPPSNPDEFNYHKYLSIRHIYKQSFLTHIQGSGDAVRWSPRIRACVMRNRLLQSYRNLGLEPCYYGLISALTLGYKEDVDAGTRQAFTRAGVMHIMALSGFNVGIIAIILGFLLGIFNGNPAGTYAKTVITVLFLWLFAMITGLSPSVTRATIMFSFLLIGRLLHRRVNTYNILFVSAFLLLTFSPGMLSDISFQLSFAAVAGILVYEPLLKSLLMYKNPVISKIWQLFSLSCAAQLATLPLSLFYFHQFPVYFWLTNLYVVPLVSVIICISGFYLAMVWIKPFALLTGKILAGLLKMLLLSVTVVEKLPFSMISRIYISEVQAAVLMLMIFFLPVVIHIRKSGWLPILLVFLMVFEGITIWQSKQLRDQKAGVITTVRRTTAISLISGKNSILLTDSKRPDQDNLDFAFGNYWIKHGVNPVLVSTDSLDTALCTGLAIPGLYCRPLWRGNNLLITFNEQKLVWLRDDNFYHYRSRTPLKADMVIISGGLSVNPGLIAKEVQPGIVIIDGTVNRSAIKQWTSECELSGLAFHVIAEQGAYEFTGK